MTQLDPTIILAASKNQGLDPGGVFQLRDMLQQRRRQQSIQDMQLAREAQSRQAAGDVVRASMTGTLGQLASGAFAPAGEGAAQASADTVTAQMPVAAPIAPGGQADFAATMDKALGVQQSAPSSPAALAPRHPAVQAVGAATLSGQVDPADAWAKLYSLDPEMGDHMVNSIKSLDAMRLSRISESNDALGMEAFNLLRQFPDASQTEQRRAAALAMAPQLAQHGINPRQIASADYSVGGLQGLIGQAQGLKGAIEQQNKERQEAIKGRSGTLSQGQSLVYDGHTVASVAPKPEYVTTQEGAISTRVDSGAAPAISNTSPAATGAHLGPQIESTVSQFVPGVTVTSRARTPEHNAAVGGVGNSYHLTDNARDFVPPQGMSMAQLASAVKAKLPGYTVLNEGSHVHVQPPAGTPRSSAGGGPPSVIRGNPKTSESEGTPTLTPDAIESLAQQVAAGGDIPSLGFGKSGAALKAQILNRAAVLQKQNGNDGAAMVLVKSARKANAAALQDLTKRNGVMSASKNTATANGDLLVSAATTGAGTTGSPLLNRWQQAYRSGVKGSPDVASFGLAINTFANEYAKVVSGATGSAGVTEGARQEMLKHLSEASTPQQVRAIVAQAKKEMASSTNALSDQIKTTQNALRTGGQGSNGSKPTVSNW